MQFLPTIEQLDLQRGVRDLLADRFPLDRLPGGYDAQLWQELTATGVFGLRTDLGLGLAEAVLVVEDLEAERARAEGALFTAALQVGLATRVTELAVAYAKEREQFGRPIGTFQ